MAYSHLLENPEDFFIRRHGPGIQLNRPKKDSLILGSALRLTNLMQLPIHIYFLDYDSNIQNLNEITLKNCGFDSLRSVVGKNISINSKKETAVFSMHHDQEVLRLQQMIIKEQNYERLDDFYFQTVSFKFPWYDEDNHILGLFGCSIVLNNNTNSIGLVESLNALTQTGLFGSTSPSVPGTKLPGLIFENTYLSQRESECVYYLKLGNTTKMITQILNISSRTVEQYLENAKIKLRVSNKAELLDKIYIGN